MEDRFKDSIIEEAQHDQSLNDQSPETRTILENTILKLVVGLEKYYDI